MVTIASSTDKTFKKYLTTAAPVDGYSITNIEWSEKIGATKVTIAKDGQTATLGFNEALLHRDPRGKIPWRHKILFQRKTLSRRRRILRGAELSRAG